MCKVIRKFLSLCLILSIVISIFPASQIFAAEQVQFEIALSDACYVRNRAQDRDNPLGGSTLVVDKTGRISFLKFDFADYKDYINDISEIKLCLNAMDASGENNFTVSIMPDSMESWSSSTLTWNIATEKGMCDAGELIYTSESIQKQVWVETVDIKEAVKQHFSDNPQNTIVTFKIHTSLNVPYQIFGINSVREPKLTVKQEVVPQTIVDKVYNELTFDKISEDDEDNVISHLNFITDGVYSTKITWTSSDEETVNPKTGIVRRPLWGCGNKNVTLTALIEYGVVSREKEFEITVPESSVYPDDMLDEYNVYSCDSTFIRGGSYADSMVNTGNLVVDSGKNGGQLRMGFVKFDFTGYEEYLENANAMELRLDTSYDADVANNNNFVVYVLPENLEDIDTGVFTYNMAKNSGQLEYTDNLVHIETSVGPSQNYRTIDILPKVLENIREGDDKVVWLKIASTEGKGYTINGSVAQEAIKPALIIRYPKPARYLDLFTIKFPEVIDSDIEIPSNGDFGSSMTWESSDQSIIAIDGKVNAGDADEDYTKEDAIVTLKATAVSDGESSEKEYTMRVRRNGVIDAKYDIIAKEDEINTDSENLTLGGTSGHIPIISFDVSCLSDGIKNSRKIVLKLYGSDEYEGKTVTAVPVNDAVLKSLDSDLISYSDAVDMVTNSDGYSASASFGNNSYVVLDVTEYMHSINDGIAMFALVTEGPRFSMVSVDGELNYEPKLIVSPLEYTDQYAADLVANSISFEDLSSESIDAVRKSLNLPLSGRFYSTINWSSNNEDIINPLTGAVSRQDDTTTVTLTATVVVGSATAKREFVVTVIKNQTDAEYAAYLVSTLAPDNDILTSSIALKGENLEEGTSVTWVSNEPYEARVNGFNLEIFRPTNADLPVNLTATLTYKGQTASKTFGVILVRSADKNILHNRKIISGDDDASKAIDENIDTVWNISDSSVTIDMGSARVVSGMTIVPEECGFSDLLISISDDMYKWEKVFSEGIFQVRTLNHISFERIAYGRYIKLDFPNSAKAISFMAAYSFINESADDVFTDVDLPGEAKSDFVLTESIYSGTVVWKSSSSVINIEGYIAKVNPASNGESVTLTAEVEIGEKKYTKSYVVYVPGTGTTSGGGGGKGSSGGSVFVASPVAPVPSEQKSFTDLYLASWATDYINYLADKGIVNGKSKTEFAPNDNLKREEMAKIISLAFDLHVENGATEFSDVKNSEWYAPYIAVLKNYNIASGVGDGTFGTGLDITRQDAFKMISSVLELDTSNTTATSFNDDAEISDYARGCINALVAIGIVGGDENGNVNPTARITRAEIAKVICLAISYK